MCRCCFLFFFFNDTATTEIYTLSLHDALPISASVSTCAAMPFSSRNNPSSRCSGCCARDRKSTRLNSSHGYISYAVFCLKKKKKNAALHAEAHLLQQRARLVIILIQIPHADID